MASKKEINSSVISQITGIEEVTKGIKEIESKEIFSEERILNFSFSVDKRIMNFFRDFILFKREEDFHYNQSKAFREGIEILREHNKNLPRRPKNVKIATRKGRRSGDRGSGLNEKYATSFNISEVEREFIYDYIYDKSKFEDFKKEDFLEDLIKGLREKYKIK